jgi:hypothetical protein
MIPLNEHQVWVKRKGEIWQGHWMLQFHSRDLEDARYYAGHIRNLATVERIEIRGALGKIEVVWPN